MNDVNSSDDQQRQNEQNWPEATVVTSGPAGQMARMVVSRLWIATAICALVAGGLVWWQLSAHGPTIEVHFSEGYGLEAGDPVRYRGITVGEVQKIVLAATLEGVIVHIELTQAAVDLAREGARFWIARPNISIGQVHGLDTLVGGRYVGVLPAAAGSPPCSEFYGLDVASTPVSNIAEGLEVTLESKNRYGLQVGSPINYRGVTVGQILSVGLTNDAATVEARAFIEPEYRQLVREQTRFWSSSGLDVKIGFSGIELDADTLATIAAGGVAFATPSNPGNPAATGQRFQLYKSPREQWLEWQPRVAIGSATLPQGAVSPRPVLGTRNQRGALGVLGAGRQRGWLLMLDDGRLIGPANVLIGETDEEYQLEVAGNESSLPLAQLNQSGLLVSGRLEQTGESRATNQQEEVWPVRKLRVAELPEEVVVTCGSAELTLPISAPRLMAEERGWVVDPSVPLDDSWNGASVIAASDGFVIGILIRDDERSLITLLTEELLDSSALD